MQHARWTSLSLSLLVALAAAMPATAAQTTTFPAWEALSPAQRDLLIAPLKEHWNSDPSARPRLMQRAERWQRMTPDERAKAHRGFDRWQSMDPEKREAMRALFQVMRNMTPEQRLALRQQWKAMTPAQRQAWVRARNPSGG
jgi:hypothetical protein